MSSSPPPAEPLEHAVPVINPDGFHYEISWHSLTFDEQDAAGDIAPPGWLFATVTFKLRNVESTRPAAPPYDITDRLMIEIRASAEPGCNSEVGGLEPGYCEVGRFCRTTSEDDDGHGHLPPGGLEYSECDLDQVPDTTDASDIHVLLFPEMRGDGMGVPLPAPRA